MPKVVEMREPHAELPQALQELLAYYMGKMVGGNAPIRGSDFSPAPLKPWLGSIALISCDGRDFRFRLMGTKLLNRFGTELTGKRFSDLDAAVLGDLSDRVQRCAAMGSAVIGGATCRKGLIQFVDLLLPLAGQAGAIDTVLLACYPVTEATKSEPS